MGFEVVEVLAVLEVWECLEVYLALHWCGLLLHGFVLLGFVGNDIHANVYVRTYVRTRQRSRFSACLEQKFALFATLCTYTGLALSQAPALALQVALSQEMP